MAISIDEILKLLGLLFLAIISGGIIHIFGNKGVVYDREKEDTLDKLEDNKKKNDSFSSGQLAIAANELIKRLRNRGDR